MLARASQACTACAEDHLRCDEEKPCKRCQRRNIQCKVPPKQVDELNASPTMPEKHHTGGGDSSSLNNPILKPDMTNDRLYQMSASPPTEMPAGDIWSQGPSHHAPTDTEIDVSASLAKDYADLITPNSVDMFAAGLSIDSLSGVRTPRGLISFGLETDLDLSMVDLSFLESYNSRIPFQFDEHETPQSISGSALGDCAAGTNYGTPNDRSIQRLRWHFVPEPQDHGYAEHNNLLLPADAEQNSTPRNFIGMDSYCNAESLDLASRDKILSIFLSQMKHPISQVTLSFPSVELLDILIRYFLTSPTSNAKSWIHLATFTPKQTRPELLLAMAAMGAVLTPDPSLQKLGFAMQEVVRHQLPVVFESDNTMINNLDLLQAYMLCLETGLWSGNNRKMEICESSRLPLVTILRRRGLFHHAAYPPVLIISEDVSDNLDSKWRSWVRQESFKRLVYNLLQHDAQLSMVLFTNPLLSYGETSLSIPCSRDLWTASSAQKWKELYCVRFAMGSTRIPTLLECIANLDLLECSKAVADTTLGCLSILCAMWGMVWEYRQFSILLAAQSRYWDNGILMVSRYQELVKMLRYFHMGYKNESTLHLNLILMHMHMSLEDVQILATMEDPRKTSEFPPSIHSWSKSKECRQALWHAGQVIRELKTLPSQRLRDFMAVALYHASLALWAYGMAISHATEGNAMSRPDSMNMNIENIIWLDGDDTDGVHRYIALERGIPALHGVQPHIASASLADPGAILELVLQIMHRNHSGEREPPLVENLVSLIEKLRDISK
ncbi:putative C6 transcription factor RegA [Aspergillus nomiae NRRL 13137]|uniref:Putative C6 transcription factor RegA n=1 Tax=Aspergillus nomiae NRRL (strain ATCC 15546 / NRRL 13137 / CBS 260.88 / M93) TaxID=1509407 RepID=A0A0L1IRV8_ASPN3|nr:putative C6 transcription factor RegA [Aspergillus nomiae NRRL 13137]KNG82110.1 putative C6 transcription factor RegA [Aspergillus nomiae NRRL 13137]